MQKSRHANVSNLARAAASEIAPYLPLLSVVALGLAIRFAYSSNWGFEAAVRRALVVGAAVPIVVASAWVMRRSRPTPRLLPALLLIAGVAAGYYGTRTWDRFHEPLRFNDIGESTFQAVGVLSGKENPYAATVDRKIIRSDSQDQPDRHFDGYTYPPATVLFYSPFIINWDRRGIPIANLVTQLCLVFACYWFFRRDPTPFLVAATLLLTSKLALVQYYTVGVIDALPTALGVTALLYRRNAFLSGVLMGLSLSSKFLPGAAILPFMLGGPSYRRQISAVALTCALFSVPFFYWDAEALINNVLMWGVSRPTDATALLHYAPSYGSVLFKLSLVTVLAGTLYWVHVKGPENDARRWMASIMVLVAFLISNKVNHGNYLVWLFALLAIGVAQLYRSESPRGSDLPP